MTGELARAAAAAIEDVLTEWGMWLHQPPERQRRAAELADDGATPDTLREVCEFVERQVKHDLDLLGKRLSVQLARGLWRDTYRAAQAAAERAPAEGAMASDLNWMPPEPINAAQEAQLRAMQAYTRLQHDRHKPVDVASDLGVSIAELRKLAVLGADIYGAADPEAVVARVFEPKTRRVRR